MKRIIAMICCALCTWCMGCNNDDGDILPQIKPEATGTFTDSDGTEYPWVRYNGLDWMAINYKGGSPYYKAIGDSANVVSNIEIYGNLLSYDDAVACAPEGWRLPTDEDWQKLEQALGMDVKTSNQTGWRGSPVGELLQQNESGAGMNLLLSGCINLQASSMVSLTFRYLHVYGYYWSSTLEETNAEGRVAYYRKIGTINSGVERNLTLTEEYAYGDDSYDKYMSVRYVRDAQ